MKAFLAAVSLSCGLLAGESVERRDAKLDELLDANAKVETLCTGFKWSEGPVWDVKGKRLLFSDVPNNVIHQWKEGDKEATIYLKPSGFTGAEDDGREHGSNGLAFDAKGQLLCCEHGDRRISYLTANGGKRTLADSFEGKRFHSPNDLAIAASGDVYFADPPYGHKTRSEKDPASEMDFCGVYRITPQGSVSLIARDLSRPNGIALTPDGRTLYVAQSSGKEPVIFAYSLNPDGTAGERRVFFDTRVIGERGGPDGLKVDARGNVFATGPGGVLVIDASGKLLGRILCENGASNVAFGENNAWLYICSVDRILRVPLKK